MICEGCKKEIIEGNFTPVPCQKHVNGGIINTLIHIILCDECSTKVPNKVSGSVKILDAEIVKEN